MKKPLTILAMDSLAALAAGVGTLLLSSYLTRWYAWPEGFALFIGAVNIAYGMYSGPLALRLKRTGRMSRTAVILLIIANSIWAGQCFTQAWRLFETASILGLGHLIFEGLFVSGLAFLEAKHVLPEAE